MSMLPGMLSSGRSGADPFAILYPLYRFNVGTAHQVKENVDAFTTGPFLGSGDQIVKGISHNQTGFHAELLCPVNLPSMTSSPNRRGWARMDTVKLRRYQG
jgi:hypothetical protein